MGPRSRARGALPGLRSARPADRPRTRCSARRPRGHPAPRRATQTRSVTTQPTPRRTRPCPPRNRATSRASRGPTWCPRARCAPPHSEPRPAGGSRPSPRSPASIRPARAPRRHATQRRAGPGLAPSAHRSSRSPCSWRAAARARRRAARPSTVLSGARSRRSSLAPFSGRRPNYLLAGVCARAPNRDEPDAVLGRSERPASAAARDAGFPTDPVVFFDELSVRSPPVVPDFRYITRMGSNPPAEREYSCLLPFETISARRRGRLREAGASEFRTQRANLPMSLFGLRLPFVATAIAQRSSDGSHSSGAPRRRPSSPAGWKSSSSRYRSIGFPTHPADELTQDPPDPSADTRGCRADTSAPRARSAA